MARKFFGIVATSVSERSFCHAGNVVTVQRNRLTGSNVRELDFLHSNTLHDEFGDDEIEAEPNDQ